MHLYQVFVNLENIRFWDQICQKSYESQNLKKINTKVGNIKFLIRIGQCTPVSIILESFSFWDQVCPKNTLGWSIRTNTT